MAFALQFGSQFFVIVNLAIEDYPHRFFRIRHRLMTACESDDSQSPKPQTPRSVDEKAFIAGAAMCDGTRHPYNRLALHGFAPLEVKLACDAAHIQRSDIGSEGSDITDKK